MPYEVKKDPAADLDYGFDWSAWLGPTDTIATSTWTVPVESGLTTHSPSISPDGKITQVWLNGGVVSSVVFSATNHITTTAGRQDERSLRVTLVNR